MGNLIRYPLRYVLSCRVEGEEVVQIAVIEITVDFLFYLGEIDHHAVGVKFAGTAVYGDYPIVAVKIFAFTLTREVKIVTS